MAGEDNNSGPYAWRSARSRGFHPPQTQGQQTMQLQEMESLGRKPVISRGHITGYSSRPGEPNVSPPLGITGAIGTQEHANAWNTFFRKPVVPAAPVASAPLVVPPVVLPPITGGVAADEQFGGGPVDQTNPGIAADEQFGVGVPTDPNAALQATVQGHSQWLQKQGVPVPPPAPISSGWQGPTQPVPTGNYTTPYGTASLQAANTSDWGTPLPPV